LKSSTRASGDVYDEILLPTDGSDAAEAAVEHAIRLARTYDARVHVLYVVEPPPAAEYDATSVLDALRREGDRVTDQTADRLERSELATVTAVRTGAAHRVILDYAAESGIDLVVMGTHGRRGLGRVLLGSVAEKVVRLADQPVMTVRHTDDGDGEAEGETGETDAAGTDADG
jgi:nucleotide-binding universal stress UspA family protein